MDLLRLAGDRVLVPAPVAAEIRRRDPSDPAVQALATAGWLETAEVLPSPPLVRALGLGAGESGVLSWALAHPGAGAIIDDLPARRRAEGLGISVRGTLGLTLQAKEMGVIPAARPVVEALRRAGLYLSDSVIERALARVGE